MAVRRLAEIVSAAERLAVPGRGARPLPSVTASTTPTRSPAPNPIEVREARLTGQPRAGRTPLRDIGRGQVRWAPPAGGRANRSPPPWPPQDQVRSTPGARCP